MKHTLFLLFFTLTFTWAQAFGWRDAVPAGGQAYTFTIAGFSVTLPFELDEEFPDQGDPAAGIEEEYYRAFQGDFALESDPDPDDPQGGIAGLVTYIRLTPEAAANFDLAAFGQEQLERWNFEPNQDVTVEMVNRDGVEGLSYSCSFSFEYSAPGSIRQEVYRRGQQVWGLMVVYNDPDAAQELEAAFRSVSFSPAP